mgnify:CR=1 FL=1
MTRVDTSHPAYVSVQQIVQAKRAARDAMLARHAEEAALLNETYRQALLDEIANMKAVGMSNYAVSKALNNTNWGQVTALVEAAQNREV